MSMEDKSIAQDETIDDRLKNESETSTIKLRDAILRSLVENNGSPVLPAGVVDRFRKSGSSRQVDEESVLSELEGAVRDREVRQVDRFFQITEVGRSRIGPIMEIALDAV